MKKIIPDLMFLIPVIGEIYLLIMWSKEDEYPLNYLPIYFTSLYQGICIALFLLYLII